MENSRFKIQDPSLQKSLPEKQEITILYYGELADGGGRASADCEHRAGRGEDHLVGGVFGKATSEGRAQMSHTHHDQVNTTVTHEIA